MLLSISSAALNLHKDINQKYYDLDKTVSVLEKVWTEFPIDGFELQLLEEWNPSFPPIADKSPNRKLAWEVSEKYSAKEIIDAFSGSPILTIHANKDIGSLICNDDSLMQQQGESLIDEALKITEGLSAKYCVFHIWDPWSKNVDVPKIQKVLDHYSSSKVYITIEGIPSHDEKRTPYLLVDNFDAITMDIRFSNMYNENTKYLSQLHKIKNIHIHADLMNGYWIINNIGVEDIFGETVQEIIERLPRDYQGILTLESIPKESEWDEFKDGIEKLRDCISEVSKK